jgi:hypothetical protein
MIRALRAIFNITWVRSAYVVRLCDDEEQTYWLLWLSYAQLLFRPLPLGVHALQGTCGFHLQLACGVQYLLQPSPALGRVPVFSTPELSIIDKAERDRGMNVPGTSTVIC